MPMQPSPMAETSSLLLPSVRLCISSSQSGARYDLERRRSRLTAHHRLDVGGCDGRVPGAVCSVDLIVDAPVGIDEPDVLVDADGVNLAIVVRLRTAEPGRALPSPGSNVQVVTIADDPDRYRL